MLMKNRGCVFRGRSGSVLKISFILEFGADLIGIGSDPFLMGVASEVFEIWNDVPFSEIVGPWPRCDMI
jgi:hypothetical protein